MRENIRLMFKNNETEIINNYQSLIFMAKDGILDRNINDIRNTMLILLNKLANNNIQGYLRKHNGHIS